MFICLFVFKVLKTNKILAEILNFEINIWYYIGVVLKIFFQSGSIPKSFKSPSCHFTQFFILEADALWITFTFSRFSRNFSEKFLEIKNRLALGASFMNIKDFLLRSVIALLWCFHPFSSLPDHLMTLHTCVFVWLVSFCIGKTPSTITNYQNSAGVKTP